LFRENSMTSSNSWNCDGIPKNDKKYPNLGGAHEPHENYSLDCEICGLPKESSIAKKADSPNKILLPAALLVLLGIGGVGIWQFTSRKCPEGQIKQNGNCIILSDIPNSNNKSNSNNDATATQLPVFNSEWVSLGERHLFKGKSNARRDDGIAAFKNNDFTSAKQHFQKAVADDKNDPEVQIYLNNTQAALQGSPLKIAVVIPVEEKEASATEMLRGIADAQTEFNQQGGVAGKLVQVIVANDSNNPDRAQSIAQELAKDTEILGVIGHNSSKVSQVALTEYEKAGLVMVSPTSTATNLKNTYFFRTVPNDALNGKKLAEYAQKTGATKLAIFYDATSNYSKSLQQAFESNFAQLGGNILESIDISDRNLDSRTAIEKLKSQQADAIALFPSTETTSIAIGIARANTELPGDKLTMLGGDALYSSDVLDQGGTDVNGLIIAIPWFFQSQPYGIRANKRWIGTINWRTAASFDATKALLEALKSNPDRASIPQNLQLLNLSANETAGEPLSFTNGERSNIEPVLVQIDSGFYRQSGEFANGFKLIKELF
jgi:branched-chain amino acid transport system substrate-binding protein